MHKRKRVALLTMITVLTVILFSACKTPKPNQQNYRENDGSFSVHYLDVGQGDCALIYFPDGKTMLIDTGNGTTDNNQYVLSFLDAFSVDRIDYLVLTHPDSDHVGGAKTVIENLEIGTAYVPHVLEASVFPQLNQAFNALEDKNVETKISTTFVNVKGEGYAVAFLLPYPPDVPSSSYDKLYDKYPTESDINNVSPIIYVEYQGVRFLFSGDADAGEEKLLLSDEKYLVASFNELGININLNQIDFLKVAHHGSKDSTCAQFLDRINPKNSVISVRGDNKYGLPSTEVLQALANTNEDHKIYRTDIHGTVSVIIDENGDIRTIVDRS